MRISFIILSACALLLSGPAQCFPANEPSLYGFAFSESKNGWNYGVTQIKEGHDSHINLKYDFRELGINPSLVSAGANGIVYCLTGYPEGNFSTMREGEIIGINLLSGHIAHLGNWTLPKRVQSIIDLTYNLHENRFYLLATTEDAQVVIPLNEEMEMSGTPVTVKDDIEFAAICSDDKGRILLFGADGILYYLSMTSGITTNIMNTGIKPEASLNSMTFDNIGNTVMLSINGSDDSLTPTCIYRIPLAPSDNNTITKTSSFTNGEAITGLYLLSPESPQAPKTPEIIYAGVNSDYSQATFNCKTPSELFNGNIIEDQPCVKVIIERNGENIFESDPLSPGSDLLFEDKGIKPNTGYTYQILAAYDNNRSIPATIFLYSGSEKPERVSIPTITPEKDYSSATITWLPPTRGAYGGEIDPEEVTYTVTRLPDMKVIAEKIKDLRVTDYEIQKSGIYSYEVIANNARGESIPALTEELLLGPAVSAPIEENFDDVDNWSNRWLILDANGDFNTWVSNTLSGAAIFGDYRTALEYSPSDWRPGTPGSDNEWLITGPLQLEGGEPYYIELAVRSSANAVISVFHSEDEYTDGMSLISKLDIAADNNNIPGRRIEPFTYFIDFTGLESNVEFVGLRLTELEKPLPDTPTPIDTAGDAKDSDSTTPPNPKAMLQICSFKIHEGLEVKELIDDPDFNILDNKIIAGANDCEIQLHNVNGMPVSVRSRETIDIAGLSKGVYILTVFRSTGRRSYRILR